MHQVPFLPGHFRAKIRNRVTQTGQDLSGGDLLQLLKQQTNKSEFQNLKFILVEGIINSILSRIHLPVDFVPD